MLIDFTMQNFKSFKQETVLSAEAGERLRKYQDENTLVVHHKRVLKNLLIFGPNGSGKSNLVGGLKRMQAMVLNDPAKVTDPLPLSAFALDTTSRQNETRFRVQFSKGTRVYEYAFAYNQHAITYERLSVVLKTRQKTYFERSQTGFTAESAALRAVVSKTKANSLVLYTAMQNNFTIPTEVFTWFSTDLIFVGDYGENPTVSALIGLARSDEVKKRLLEFLHFADFNIVDLEVVERPAQALFLGHADGDMPMMNQLFAVHKVYDEAGRVQGKQRLAIDSESRGTQKILMIALMVIHAELNGNGQTLLFDEFDDSLHLELSQAMVKIFNAKANKNQFILTTQELKLLDAKVRVDQIYLVDKDFKGESELTAIFDFKDTRHTTRSGISYMKRYVEGQFGAKPIIEPQRMLAALTDDERTKKALGGE